MSIARDLRRHHQTLGALDALLGRFDETSWLRPAPDGGWCAAQVYRHIQIVAEQFAFPKLEACLKGEGRRKGPMSFRARMLFWKGSFPKGLRVKVEFPPEMLPVAITQEQAREALAALRSKAEDAARRLPDADPAMSAEHFLLGWLRTRDWFRFIEMHHRHHLEGQLRRLLEP